MRPTPIPDGEVWEGGHRIVVASPDGDLTGDVRPVEAVVDETEHGRRFNMRLLPDAGDVERLAAGEPLWLTFYGSRLSPFQLTFADQEDEAGLCGEAPDA